MKHSEVDAAGGDHKCNVFKEGEEKEVSARKEDQEKMKMADERRRFAHYHSRYQAHENSAKLEKKLLLRHRGQNMPVHSKGELCTQLLETQGEALTLLGNARRTLWASYVLGYYQVWEKGTSLKEVFEDLQHLLENRSVHYEGGLRCGTPALSMWKGAEHPISVLYHTHTHALSRSLALSVALYCEIYTDVYHSDDV